MPPTRRPRLRALLLALLLFATACVRVDVEEPENAGLDGAAEQRVDDAVVEDPDQGEDLAVPLQIVEGPEGSILAFVPVTIQGEGPFAFALDTGASSSVIDESIADQLGLEEVGEEQAVTGVTGGTQAIAVQIEEWSLDGVDLGARPVIVLDLGSAAEGPGLQGLLGSDVLSAFGAITVDYDNEVLLLRPRAAADGGTGS